MLKHSLRLLKSASHLKQPNNRHILKHTTFRNFILLRPSFSNWFSRMGDSHSQSIVTDLPETNTVERKDKVRLTEKEWKQRLSSEEFDVLRNKGTERAWTGSCLNTKQKGMYSCAGCGNDLFNSTTKFDSGSGWPSFFNVIKDKTTGISNVEVHTDSSHGMTRTEVLCGKCDSHMGHVFNDGPQPTGLRFCINSVCIKFKPESSGSSM